MRGRHPLGVTVILILCRPARDRDNDPDPVFGLIHIALLSQAMTLTHDNGHSDSFICSSTPYP